MADEFFEEDIEKHSLSRRFWGNFKKYKITVMLVWLLFMIIVMVLYWRQIDVQLQGIELSATLNGPEIIKTLEAVNSGRINAVRWFVVLTVTLIIFLLYGEPGPEFQFYRRREAQALVKSEFTLDREKYGKIYLGYSLPPGEISLGKFKLIRDKINPTQALFWAIGFKIDYQSEIHFYLAEVDPLRGGMGIVGLTERDEEYRGDEELVIYIPMAVDFLRKLKEAGQEAQVEQARLMK